MTGHFRHHARFYLSILCGIGVGLLPLPLAAGPRISIAGAVFFFAYLTSVFALIERTTAEDLRSKAALEDEGMIVIVLITLAVIALSLGSLVALLQGDRHGGWQLLPAIANVPLGWATLHTIMAFHYARLFYARPDGRRSGGARDARGLEFPKTDEPSISDFLYFSFVIGMTAQTSDVDVTSRAARRAAVLHGVVSFFYNTVILALTINVLTRG